MIPGGKLDRKKTLICGNTVLVMSEFYGTINPPPNFEEVPFFPGIPRERVVGKEFRTLTLDYHLIDKDGRIAQSHHIEDFLTALQQILNDDLGDWDLGTSPEYSDTSILSRVPRNIESFYDVILTNPGSLAYQNQPLCR